MLEVAIVDDEPVAVRRLARLLRDQEGVTITGTAGDATTAIQLVEESCPDLVLLDIEMPGVNGLELAAQLRSLPAPPIVIFVTAFSRFAVEAFEVAATDYLLKPVDPPRLAEAIVRARAYQASRKSDDRIAELEALLSRFRLTDSKASDGGGGTLWLPTSSGRERVSIDDIAWVEAERDYVRIHGPEKSYFLRARMHDLETRFAGHGLVRVHRSALVNIAAIAKVRKNPSRGYRLILSNGAAIDASRRFGASVRKLLNSSAP